MTWTREVRGVMFDFLVGAWGWWSGRGDTSVGTTHETTGKWTQQRETLRSDAGGIFLGVLTRSSAVQQTQCDAPVQVGHRRCGGPRWRPVSQLRFIGIGMRWSSSSDSSAVAHTGGPSSARSGVMCLVKSSPQAWNAAASVTASVAVGTQATPTSRPRLGFRRRSPRWRRHALFMTTSSKELLKLRNTATSHGCKNDVLCGGMKHSTT